MSTPADYVPPVDQPPPEADTVSPYGGFWIRFAAYSIDGMLVSLLYIPVGLAWFMALGDKGSDSFSFVMIAVGQLYHAYFVSSEKMATPGKRWCGLYVTDVDGHRLSFGHALVRNLAAALSYLTLYIGFIMAAFSDRKQALHDRIAGTLVHRRPGSSAGATVIVFVLLFFVGIVVLGILAAIAIPAYQDFQARAKAAGVIAAMTAEQKPVEDYLAKNGQWPASWQELGVPEPLGQLDPQSRTLVTSLQLGDEGVIAAELKVNHKTGALRMVPSRHDGAVTWSCESDEGIRKWMPANCRH